MQRSISEVRRVNFDCKDGETWENIPSIFFCRHFRNFGCFVEGRPSPLIRISLSLLLKALQNFVIFVIVRNFRNTLANVLGFFITEFNHRQYLR